MIAHVTRIDHLQGRPVIPRYRVEVEYPGRTFEVDNEVDALWLVRVLATVKEDVNVT